MFSLDPIIIPPNYIDYPILVSILYPQKYTEFELLLFILTKNTNLKQKLINFTCLAKIKKMLLSELHLGLL